MRAALILKGDPPALRQFWEDARYKRYNRGGSKTHSAFLNRPFCVFIVF